MALFKQCRGIEINLPSTLTDGYCYFCTDTGNFYIDYTNTDGALVRSKISSKYADKLRYLQDGNQVELDPTNIVTNSNYDTLIGTATTSKNGLMVAADKEKLDGIESGAEANNIFRIKVRHNMGGFYYNETIDEIKEAYLNKTLLLEDPNGCVYSLFSHNNSTGEFCFLTPDSKNEFYIEETGYIGYRKHSPTAIDTQISDTSEYPVQNKVIAARFAETELAPTHYNASSDGGRFYLTEDQYNELLIRYRAAELPNHDRFCVYALDREFVGYIQEKNFSDNKGNIYTGFTLVSDDGQFIYIDATASDSNNIHYINNYTPMLDAISKPSSVAEGQFIKIKTVNDGTIAETEAVDLVEATSTDSGLMSAPDKAKLDAIDLRLKTWFGTCVTAASTAEKIVTTNTADFILEAGSIVYVQFNTAVTSTSTTLNVDNTGAKAIQTSATNALTANQIAPKTVAGFIYDGTVYRMLDGTIATTTYYGMTKLSSSISSTSTATAATSSAVKAAYDLANSAVKQVIQATGAITPDDNGAITVDNVAYATNAAKLGDVASTEYLQKSGGTMSGQLTAANPAVGTQAVRNIYAGTADMTAGSSTLATGVIYCVYE